MCNINLQIFRFFCKIEFTKCFFSKKCIFFCEIEKKIVLLQLNLNYYAQTHSYDTNK